MKKNINQKFFRKKGGFTLIETAIFLTVLSLIVATSLSTYRTYQMKEAVGNGNFRSYLISNKLAAFIGYYGRLPCPADASLPPENPNAGLEQCIHKPTIVVSIETFDEPISSAFALSISPTNMSVSQSFFEATPVVIPPVVVVPPPPPPPPGPPPPVTIPGAAVGTCIGAVCRMPGGRDTDVDADTDVDNILIGGIPYVTLGMTREDTIDGWGGAFTYAMSEELSDDTTFAMNRGVINRQVRQANPLITTPPIGTISNSVSSSVGSTNSFMVAVISHGENNRGAYNYSGTLLAPCVNPAGYSLDEENCNGDHTFIDTYAESEIYNRQRGSAIYFDDSFAFFNVTNDADKWMYTTGNSMANKLGGKVGIGTPSPQADLHVMGNIEAENYQSDRVCNEDGSDCFNPDIIGGTGIDCNGGLMMGVSNGDTVCQTVVGTDNITSDICPTGEFMKTIDVGGVIVCAP